jgi:ADP-heptose:LPS heptosyltransferase
MRKEHLLVIRFSALGDVAMAVPVVYALAVGYPDIRITVLSRSYARPLFEDLAPNVNFMEADVKVEYRGVKGLNALYRRLAAKHFTKVADLHSVLRSDYLRMRFNLGRYRVEHIDKHRQLRRLLTSHKNRRLAQLPTSFTNYSDVFARLGYKIDLSHFRSIFPPEGGNLNLLPAVIGPKSSHHPWIGIAPFAAHNGKVYPPELMEQVIALLIERHPDARVFFFGKGERESQYFNQWCQRWPQCTAATQQVDSLYQELILMSHLNVMLSMDSANMHLASLTATPVVSIWGATHPYAGFVGWNQNERNIIQTEGLDCRPCSIYGQKPCMRGDMACMTRIRPETIVERIEENLINNPNN